MNRAAQQAKARKLRRFADALFAWPGPSVAEASANACISYAYGKRLLAEMRRDLGWQAR